MPSRRRASRPRRRRRAPRTRWHRGRSRRGTRAIALTATSSAWLRCTSATTHPPKPAPVRRAPAAPCVDQQLDEEVELRRRHAVVVAQARVAGEQERPEHGEVAARQRVGQSPARAAFSLTTCRARGSSRTCSIVASRRLASPSRAAIASHSARRAAYSLPASVRGRPLCTTSDRDARRQRHRRDLERAAVDEEGVAGDAEDRAQLVHQPAGHAGRERPRRRARAAASARPSSSRPARVGERDRARDGERRARRQARADGHGRRHGEVVPPGTVPPRSTTARTTPATNRAQAGSTVAGSVAAVGRELDRGRARRRECTRSGRGAVGVRPTADAAAVDGHGQDEAAVVVGVVADEVHASRGLEAPGRDRGDAACRSRAGH